MTTSRFPFESHIASMPPEHQYVIRNLWNAVSDVQTAVPILKSQITSNASSVKSVTETVNNITSTESVTQVISSSSTAGGVNNQSGNVTYSTAQADNGYFILFNDSSPIAVSLTGAPTITLPWSCVIVNYGVGVVTVTPANGTINYPNNLAAASMPIVQGQAAIIAYDGTNYWAVIIPVPPQNTLEITSKWLNSYNPITGVFGQSQPSFADISGTPSTAQVPVQSLTTTGAGAATLSGGVLNVPTPTSPLAGTTGSLGGSAMTAGQTITTTASVTGATTSMAVAVSPAVYPGDGFVFYAYVSAAGTVTVCLTCVAAGTPASSVYNVRCLV
jgi:hypothetical protein